MKKPEFRADQYGSVYRYDAAQDAYLFCGKLNGRTLDEYLCDLWSRELEYRGSEH